MKIVLGLIFQGQRFDIFMGKILRVLYIFYPDLRNILLKLKNLFRFFKELKSFKNQNNNCFDLKINPQLLDKFENHPNKAGHYLLQDVFVARKILKNNPIKHVDVGSRIDGFLIQLSLFREIEVFDIRGFPIELNNIKFQSIDFTSIPIDYYNYTDSISSLHALEHFGLGRYGDKIDSDGHLKGIRMIYEVLKTNGLFYFSVPIGPQRVEFNAHRVFSMEYLIKILTPMFDIIEFSYIDDKGFLHENISLLGVDLSSNFCCKYGCGIFELKKKG